MRMSPTVGASAMYAIFATAAGNPEWSAASTNDVLPTPDAPVTAATRPRCNARRKRCRSRVRPTAGSGGFGRRSRNGSADAGIAGTVSLREHARNPWMSRLFFETSEDTREHWPLGRSGSYLMGTGATMRSILREVVVVGVVLALVTFAPRARAAGDLEAVGADGREMGPFSLVRTEVAAEVDGNIISVDVHQRFTNPFASRIEAVYTFPLPERAAVDDMDIRIGDRIVRAVVQRREQARQTYAMASAAGRHAGLLEQERPNVFTVSLANIDPGGEIVVHLHYFDLARHDGGRYEMAFPMTVGPRFVPGNPLGSPRQAMARTEIRTAFPMPRGSLRHTCRKGCCPGTRWGSRSCCTLLRRSIRSTPPNTSKTHGCVRRARRASFSVIARRSRIAISYFGGHCVPTRWPRMSTLIAPTHGATERSRCISNRNAIRGRQRSRRARSSSCSTRPVRCRVRRLRRQSHLSGKRSPL